MAGTAPTEIQHIDQQEADLYKKMAPNVEQATGQPTPPASLKPEDETPLDKIGAGIADFARYHGSNLKEYVIDKEPDADVVTIGGNEAAKITQKRGLRARFLSRLGLKK